MHDLAEDGFRLHHKLLPCKMPVNIGASIVRMEFLGYFLVQFCSVNLEASKVKIGLMGVFEYSCLETVLFR